LDDGRHALNTPGVAQLQQGLVRDPVEELPLKLGVEERNNCDFERINSDPLSGLLAKRGAAFRAF
jgi:hypothetical protein